MCHCNTFSTKHGSPYMEKCLSNLGAFQIQLYIETSVSCSVNYRYLPMSGNLLDEMQHTDCERVKIFIRMTIVTYIFEELGLYLQI